MSTAPNTNDKSYKKAFRQYQKNKKPSPKDDWTPFRAAEKRYRVRFPPPDLSRVLDLGHVDSDEERVFNHDGPNGSRIAIETRAIDLKCGFRGPRCGQRRRAYAVPQIPGLVVLPSYLTPDQQRSLVRWSLSDQARSPNDTNLDIHYILPEEGLWKFHVRASRNEGTSDTSISSQYTIQPKRPTGSESDERSPVGPRQLIDNVPVEPSNFDVLNTLPKPPPPPSSHLPPIHVSKLLPKLRWANIGYSYHWGSKTYDFSRPKADYPSDVRNVCKDVVASINWRQVWDGVDDEDWGEQGPDWETWPETYEPDAGIVNFYQPKDTLCGHVDRSEVCSTSPLVSISLGNAAIFLIGGLTRSVEPVPIILRSGDIVVMSGPGCRRAYHGVPRILEGTLPVHLQVPDDDEDWQLFAEYLRTTRININVRQVFPRGFDPFVPADAV